MVEKNEMAHQEDAFKRAPTLSYVNSKVSPGLPLSASSGLSSDKSTPNVKGRKVASLRQADAESRILEWPTEMEADDLVPPISVFQAGWPPRPGHRHRKVPHDILVEKRDIGIEVRKTVNELEKSLAYREQENINLKILVRELEQEREGITLDSNSGGMGERDGLREGVVRLDYMHPPLDHTIPLFDPSSQHLSLGEGVVIISKAHETEEVMDGVDKNISTYHEETRQLRAQLNLLSSQLGRAVAEKEARNTDTVFRIDAINEEHNLHNASKH